MTVNARVLPPIVSWPLLSGILIGVGLTVFGRSARPGE
jgi:hypothetical protein